MLGGPIAGSLSHPSSDILPLELVPAFLQYPPDELVMGTSKSVVLGGRRSWAGAFAESSATVRGGLCRSRGMDELACSEPFADPQTWGLFWTW